MRRTLPILAVCCCVWFAGCGQSGPMMYDAWGSVTFDGKPIPDGRIDFFPDGTKGNDGPQGFARIKNGKFDTRDKGQGHAGGPMLVKVAGFDGKTDNPAYYGQPIFNPHDIQADLPKASGEQSFNVPASAAENFVAPVKSKS